MIRAGGPSLESLVFWTSFPQVYGSSDTASVNLETGGADEMTRTDR